jgi:hypothetical protein
MICANKRGRISCDVRGCKAGQSVELGLTLRGGWVPVKPEGWQVGIDSKDPVGLLVARCPEHAIKPSKIEEPTPAETAAILHS